MQSLQAKGFLDDTRMTQAFVRARSSRHGRVRLSFDLERRGVARDTIAAHLPTPAEETEAARALWQRRFGVAPGSPQQWARQARFLLARGFSRSTVTSILREAPEPDTNPPSDTDPPSDAAPAPDIDPPPDTAPPSGD